MSFSDKETQQEIATATKAALYLKERLHRTDLELFSCLQTVSEALLNGLSYDDIGLDEKTLDIISSEIKDNALELACQFFDKTDDEPSWLFKLYEESDERLPIKKKRLFLRQAVNQKIVSWREIKKTRAKKLQRDIKYLANHCHYPDPELFPKMAIIKNAIVNGLGNEEVLENLIATATNEIRKNALNIMRLSGSQPLKETEEEFINLAVEHHLISQQEQSVALNQHEKLSRKKFHYSNSPLFRSQLQEVDMGTSFALLF